MKRHDIDVISLMAGLLFAGLAAVFVLKALGTVDVDLRAAPAVALIVAGCAGIAASLTSSRRSDERHFDEHHFDDTESPDSGTVVADRLPES
jgi:hypothetical protein